MERDWQKIILVLIVIVLLAGLAWELKYIEEMLSTANLSVEEQCDRMCSERGEVAYVSDSSCYCKEPITFQKKWRCFFNLTMVEDDIFSSKFNTSAVRNIAVKAAVQYPAPNAPATKIFGIYNEISNRIFYVSDPRKDEYIAAPLETWELRGGDCDDFSVLLASLYEAVGLDASIVEVYRPDRGHVFVIVKIEQDLEAFMKLYKTMLEKYTPYFSEKQFNFVLLGASNNECQSLEKTLEGGNSISSFYIIVDSTTGDYPGSSDPFEEFSNVKFIKIGE
jgi:hypothetical protein